MRIFGIDPGSIRTGYGCVETDGRRHHLIACGAIASQPSVSFPDRLARIHSELTRLLRLHRPDTVAVENVFHAKNASSALKLGHARGVAILAAVQAGCTIVEYTPAEVKRAVVGYGRAEKRQVQHMIKLLLGLSAAPQPHDAADALAVAVCHLHSPSGLSTRRPSRNRGVVAADAPLAHDASAARVKPGLAKLRSWRHYRPPTVG